MDINFKVYSMFFPTNSTKDRLERIRGLRACLNVSTNAARRCGVHGVHAYVPQTPREMALFGTKGGGGVPEDPLTAKFIIGSEILAVRSPWTPWRFPRGGLQRASL